MQSIDPIQQRTAARFIRLYLSLRRLWWWFTHPVGNGVRLILVQRGQVLLVRHTYMPGWLLPGGAVEWGETLEEAARREAGEELGASLGELRLEGVFTNFRESKTDHITVFSSTDAQVPGKANIEIAEWAFFDPAHLPEDTHPGHRRRIEEYFIHDPHVRTGKW